MLDLASTNADVLGAHPTALDLLLAVLIFWKAFAGMFLLVATYAVTSILASAARSKISERCA